MEFHAGLRTLQDSNGSAQGTRSAKVITKFCNICPKSPMNAGELFVVLVFLMRIGNKKVQTN